MMTIKLKFRQLSSPGEFQNTFDDIANHSGSQSQTLVIRSECDLWKLNHERERFSFSSQQQASS